MATIVQFLSLYFHQSCTLSIENPASEQGLKIG